MNFGYYHILPHNHCVSSVAVVYYSQIIPSDTDCLKGMHMWSFQRNKLAAGKLSGRRPHIDMNMGAMAVSAANRSELNPGKVLALICALASSSAAWAVPGTPSAPQVVFQEDFDNTGIVQPTLGPNGTSGTDPAQATMLHTYVSAAQDINGALGQTYIASGVYSGDVNVPFWENAQWCNGIWMKGDVAGSQPYPTAELPAPTCVEWRAQMAMSPNTAAATDTRAPRIRGNGCKCSRTCSVR
ncbi:hypothetical protein [Diaphorobacter aerolatus]|uniref:Uncharacterized protein n=1 Tax=Diaphorobacter aerolatus TaxID=1288495 RepID=A0A7H0GI01_9BURK|nr:hypothetical protein [Diaphorobacter aerolatus]QNP47917.1 hypothetical protein H9K75_17600 [Diaphorobacter aerolatus]